MMNLVAINPYKLLTGEEYVFLTLFYFYTNNSMSIDVFSDNIKLHEKLIESYNNYIKENSKKIDFSSYLLNIGKNKLLQWITQYNNEPWKYSKPVIWQDRSKGEYYINQLTDSHRFEIYVDYLFKKHGFDIGLYYGKEGQYSGESKAGIEIKNDKESLKTGNIYIEYKERLHNEGSWVDSGILKMDNTTYWAIGNYQDIFFIRKSVLIDVMNGKYPDIKVKHVYAKRGTSQGYIISILDAESISDSIDTVISNIKNI